MDNNLSKADYLVCPDIFSSDTFQFREVTKVLMPFQLFLPDFTMIFLPSWFAFIIHSYSYRFIFMEHCDESAVIKYSKARWRDVSKAVEITEHGL